jgi:hypothetical protein
LDVPSKADSQSRHAVEAFSALNISGNGNGPSEHGSDEEVRETVNGEVRMKAERVNGNTNGQMNGNGNANGHANGNGNQCCSRN